MDLKDLNIKILLSIGRALLGFVTPNLRAVNVEYSMEHILLLFYYDNPPTEDERELASLVDLEFFADFATPSGDKTDFKVITLPYPLRIPQIGLRVYQRYENHNR